MNWLGFRTVTVIDRTNSTSVRLEHPDGRTRIVTVDLEPRFHLSASGARVDNGRLVVTVIDGKLRRNAE